MVEREGDESAKREKEVLLLNDQQPGDVWAHAEERYQIGQQVRGTVTRQTQFGVFVQIEPGLEGIVYAFEMGGGPSALTAYAPGQEMQLYVKNIDSNRRRLELSLGDAPMPGLLNEHALPPEVRRKRQPAAPSWPTPLPLPERQTDAHHPAWTACPSCQRPLAPGWKFCVYCGGSLQRRCPDCGSAQPDLPDVRYCHACGRLL